MSETSKIINVPFSMTHTDDPSGFSYVNDVDGLTCYAPSAERAASKLRGPLARKSVV